MALDGLKKFFIEPDESAPKKPDANATVASTPQLRPTGAFVAPSLQTGVLSAAPDPEIVASLNAAAAAGSKKAYDQFRVIYDSLAGVPDAQRVSMALTVLSNANKVNAADVLAAVDERIALVDSEKAGFEHAYKAQVNSAVVGAQNDAVKIEERINALKQEINTLEAQRVEKVRESGNAEVELARSLASFNASFDVVRSNLKRERDNITTFLPVAAK